MTQGDVGDFARELAAGWPPLTPAQRIGLAVLLRHGPAGNATPRPSGGAMTNAQLAAYLTANTQAQPTSLTDPAREAARVQRDKTARRRKKTPSTPGVTG